ncbi:50S ribosomal protein L12 [miscellaneous Crenarchaeota group-15 archaeon DG-45]|uniref:Large ribosomal subunit protein P1 n=1 Tax=miscellaneous Crenarchaeota group-15 archaeon DG-45 TaxID=1685127 RepID=A0A0M0BSW2_9ARCH|nr:MAG: 50S ribosomal protein L12 [miscellaneous Crenarchaeota group-15 archaeon DG-45]
MEYMYAAMLLHSAGREITENALENILNAAGIAPDEVRVKALVAALADVNISEALKAPTLTAAASASALAPAVEEEKAEEKAEKEEEKKEEEEDLQGLSALFG